MFRKTAGVLTALGLTAGIGGAFAAPATANVLPAAVNHPSPAAVADAPTIDVAAQVYWSSSCFDLWTWSGPAGGTSTDASPSTDLRRLRRHGHLDQPGDHAPGGRRRGGGGVRGGQRRPVDLAGTSPETWVPPSISTSR